MNFLENLPGGRACGVSWNVSATGLFGDGYATAAGEAGCDVGGTTASCCMDITSMARVSVLQK